MSLDLNDLNDLKASIAERLYIQVASWHLYLGDAGVAEALAIECSANLEQGLTVAARHSLESVQVQLGGGSTKLPLSRLIPPSQLFDLEEILSPYCR